MLSLARLQRKFRLLDSPYKTPQTLVGGSRLDGALMASSGRTATTKAMGKGSTQVQHLVETEAFRQKSKYFLGLVSYHLGKHKNAVLYLRQHLENHPEAAKVHATVARCWAEAGFDGRAAAAATRAREVLREAIARRGAARAGNANIVSTTDAASGTTRRAAGFMWVVVGVEVGAIRIACSI